MFHMCTAPGLFPGTPINEANPLPSVPPPLRPPRRCKHPVFSHIFRQAAAAGRGRKKILDGSVSRDLLSLLPHLLPPPPPSSFLDAKNLRFFGSGQIISNMLPIQNRKPFFSLFTIAVFLKPQSRSQQTRDMGCTTYGQLLPSSQLFPDFLKIS